ncbi:VOC family protein [Patescibacteria group bacterium]
MILSNYKTFLDKLFQKLNEKGIDVSNYELDHLGYISPFGEEYDKVKQEVLEIADLDHESEVGQWLVSAYKLKTPLIYKNYKIHAIELITPKDGSKVKSGFEHVEFVLNESFDSLIAKYPNLNWDISKIKRKEYSMLKLKLSDDMQVKFPRKSVLRKSKKS